MELSLICDSKGQQASHGRRFYRASACFLSLLVPLFAAGQPVYKLIELGSLAGPGGSSTVYSINESGQVTGSGPFLWSNNTLLGIGPAEGQGWYGFSISSNGYIAGGQFSPPSNHWKAVLYDGATVKILGTLFNDTDAFARGVNSHGWVVGTSQTPLNNGPYHAFVYDGTSMKYLGNLGYPSSEAYAINDAGQIVGASSGQAFLYEDGVMKGLGSLGHSARATAISPDGRYICGLSLVVGGQTLHVFMYNGGQMADLGPFPNTPEYRACSVTGVTSLGQMVGYSHSPGWILRSEPWIYSPSSGMVSIRSISDTRATGYVLGEVEGINSRGWITGNGYDVLGQPHALLLIPSPFVPTALRTMRGIPITGSVDDLAAADDVWASWRPGPVLSSAEAPIDVSMQATSPLPSPTLLTFEVETHCSTPNIGQVVSLFNFQTGAWEVVDTRLTTTVDSSVQVTVADNARRFVSPTDRSLRARIAYKAKGPVLHYPWRAHIDTANWTVVP
jgi:probable HAF family extracellular repeat protein